MCVFKEGNVFEFAHGTTIFCRPAWSPAECGCLISRDRNRLSTPVFLVLSLSMMRCPFFRPCVDLFICRNTSSLASWPHRRHDRTYKLSESYGVAGCCQLRTLTANGRTPLPWNVINLFFHAKFPTPITKFIWTFLILLECDDISCPRNKQWYFFVCN